MTRDQIAEAMKCSRADCERDAVWQVGAIVYASKTMALRRKGAAHFMTSICVCDHHRRKATVEEFFTPEGSARIRHAFRAMQKADPDFATLQLNFALIVGGAIDVRKPPK